jgi:P-type Ca2+ transporter type 2C
MIGPVRADARAAAAPPAPDGEPRWHSEPVERVVALLGTDVRSGLTTSAARARLERDGRNELAAVEPTPRWRKFIAQFANGLVVLLLVATGISAALWLHERDAPLPYEAIVIFSVVLLNAILGYAQEARAQQAVAALRRMSAARARVVRDGGRTTVAAAELVAGDVLVVEEGDTIAADARVVASSALKVAEASLTGESLPVAKDALPVAADVTLGDRTSLLFAGTSATSGRGLAVVVATGMRTQMGLIAGALEAAPDQPTPLQQELDGLGRRLGLGVILIAIAMILTIVLVEDVRTLTGLVDVLILGVALAVAAVPEGLPAVVTAVLALGVQRMAKRNAVVRQLAAVETLGSASVIASDKTGTLTRNEMTVRTLVTASGRVRFDGTGYAPLGAVRREGEGERAIGGALRTELDHALTVARRANNAAVHDRDGAWRVEGDPTEGALIVAARKAGLTDDVLARRFERAAEVPFSSERKVMTAVDRDLREGRLCAFTKGAPDVLLARCAHEVVGEGRSALTDARRREIADVNHALARAGLRTLGLASRPLPADALAGAGAEERLERDLDFAGLVGMIDPPRPEAAAAVARARTAGIRPLMITGDHPVTAAAIAAELGLADEARVVTGVQLEALSDDALTHTVAEASVYARVDPKHKLRIVRALQRRGAIVAMTGDGVNDAPALKAADIGVAMGVTGTDVSREAADIVLADDNFATIVAAVEEGRTIFANIRKFLRYLLSSNAGEVMTMFFGVLLAGVIGLPSTEGVVVLPVLATQLLWINLLSDGAPALALGVDPAVEAVMHKPPRPAGEPVITRSMWRGIVLVGIVMAAATLYVLDASLPGGLVEGDGDLRYAQTMAFTTLVFCSVFTVFNARSDERSAFRRLFTNAWLWASLLLALALQAAVVYVPFLQQGFGTVALAPTDWLRCALAGSCVLWARELSKALVRRRSARSRHA